MVRRVKKESGLPGKKVISMSFKGQSKAEVIEASKKYLKNNPTFKLEEQGFLEDRFYFIKVVYREGVK